MKAILILLSIAFALACVGCGGGGGGSVVLPPVDPPLDPPIGPQTAYCRLFVAGVQNDMLPGGLVLNCSYVYDYGGYIKILGNNRMAPYNGRTMYEMEIYIPYTRSTRCPVSSNFLAGTQTDAVVPFYLGDSTNEFGVPREFRCDSYLQSTMTQYGNATTGAYWVGTVAGKIFRPSTGLIYDFKLEFSLPHT